MRLSVLKAVLEDRGFVTREEHPPFDLLAESERIFLAIKRFQAVADMLDGWDSLQAQLASDFYTAGGLQSEKLWDSYLVLICPGLADMDREVARRTDVITGDLAYCRKLLLDAASVETRELLAHRLSPLFTFEPRADADDFDPLTALRDRLRQSGVTNDLLALLDETDPTRLIDRAKAGGQR